MIFDIRDGTYIFFKYLKKKKFSVLSDSNDVFSLNTAAYNVTQKSKDLFNKNLELA